MKNRQVIYFHYDLHGQADTACLFAVRALRKAGAQVLFVTNGRLDETSRAAVRALDVRLLERENIGFDVGAYRQALFALGRESLAGADELILMNYTLAGPVHPLASKMGKGLAGCGQAGGCGGSTPAAPSSGSACGGNGKFS